MLTGLKNKIDRVLISPTNFIAPQMQRQIQSRIDLRAIAMETAAQKIDSPNENRLIAGRQINRIMRAVC